MTSWEEEMARDAEIAASAEAAASGGSFFSVRAGVLSFNGMPIPGNLMAAIIVDSVFENVLYEGDFNADRPTPPTCFAFSRDDKNLKPHETVVARGQAVNETCAGCPNNAWGSAERGRGKACRNVRRLAMIPAGVFDSAGRFKPYDATQVRDATMGFLKLPVTSVRGYAQFVLSVANTLRRPPYGVYTKVTVTPDAKTQVKVTFEPIDEVPSDIISTVMLRRKEAAVTIDQPYNLDGDADDRDEKPAAKVRDAGKRAAPARKGGRY